MSDQPSRVDFEVKPLTGPLRGSVKVPSDKSLGHRALMLAAIADGVSEIRGFSHGEDNVATLNCMRAMGIEIEVEGDTVKVHGKGLNGLSAPAGPLDCGNSGTTMRLLSGILAAMPFQTTLIGDESLSKRPMARIADPLRKRGAQIEGKFHPAKVGEITAPLVIGPLPEGHVLGAIEHNSKVASAQVKSALLLSGLYADGPTYVAEPILSRDHSERMLSALGVPLRRAGTVVELDPSQWDGRIAPLDMDVPGDLSAAAFLLVAAQLRQGSEIKVRGVGLNRTRSGIVDMLKSWGVDILSQPQGDACGEPFGDLLSAYRPVRGGEVGGELVTRAIDEIPIFCVMAARAKGTTHIRDAAELRVKESDRIAVMVNVLRAFGVQVEELPDGMVIEGQGDKPLKGGADAESHGDHRIAMSAAILGLFADGPTRVRHVECVATSFPKFAGTLRALGGDIHARRIPLDS